MASIQLNAKQTADFELLANGGFAPLTGFQGQADYDGVVETMHLADGQPWSIPVVLGSETGEVGETVSLVGSQGEDLGTISIEEVFTRDLKNEAEKVYRTTDEAHPGVAALYSENARVVAGPIVVGVYSAAYNLAPITLGPDELFVLGDNRPNSSDSHSWGTLPVDHVIGKVVLSYWPPPDWGLIRHGMADPGFHPESN